MNDIIDGKITEWTEGISSIDANINVFEKIRDIPFLVIPEFFDRENGISGIISENKGFCVPKHYLLGAIFRRLGMKVKYHTYSFRWEDVGVDYPPRLKDMSSRLPVTYHLACKVMIKDKWVLLDATWDSPLKKSGFPVNTWQGRENTMLAVKPIDEFIHEDADEHAAFYKEKVSTLPYKKVLLRFSKELNKWLGEVRNKGLKVKG